MVNNDEKLVNWLCTRHWWDSVCIALATYFQEKRDWKLSKPREGLPASETSAGTKAGGRGMARAGEGARPSALRPLALQPLWWDNHGLHVAASAASQLPRPPPASSHSLHPHLLLCLFRHELACNRCVAGNEALHFFLSYFSTASIPHLTSCGPRRTIGDGGGRTITKTMSKQSLKPPSFTWPFSPHH